MYFGDYDYETELSVVREEAEEEGAMKDKVRVSRAFFSRGFSADEAAQFLGYPVEFMKSEYSCFSDHPEWDNERIAKDMLKMRW